MAKKCLVLMKPLVKSIKIKKNNIVPPTVSQLTVTHIYAYRIGRIGPKKHVSLAPSKASRLQMYG